jgi:secreted trypsin-like serine protease
MKHEFVKQIRNLSVMVLSLIILACEPQGPKTWHEPSLPANEGSIVNGRPVTEKDSVHLHTVSIGPAEEPQCTGVVIGSHHILTAAHCLESIEGTFVHFGLDFASPHSVRKSIKKVTVHPDYCPDCTGDIKLGPTADIAIVEIHEAAPPLYRPIDLAPPTMVTNGTKVILAGFGANEKGEYETIMKMTEVPLKELGETEFSTDESRSGTCSGDSGGPAFIQVDNKLLLLGITSRGDARCRQTGVYTLPASYGEWVLDILTTPAL